MVIHLVQFEDKTIETTVTHEANVADDWMQSINLLLKQQKGSHKIIAMCCKFHHHPIPSMSNKAALLQLCFQTKCLVLQLLHMDSVPRSVLDFLSNSGTALVGIDIQSTSQKLRDEYEVHVNENRIFDVHYLAEVWFPFSCRGRPSLRALGYGILGFCKRRCSREKNGIVEGNWESRLLDKEFVEQASVDAYTCYSIAYALLKER